ncbi:acyltransferase [Porphyromonas uenonis]|uniref:acyltransferase n=1 Tax=Porphyromonas uenonis TaxID=281920 RepID=UPI00288AA5BB|nr:acyltransferase [Porphyromonas uenonis]
MDPTTIIDEGAHIGTGTTIWHFCHIMHDAFIGKQCHLGQNVVVQPRVHLGDRCRILNNVTLFTGVHCEEEVFLGPSCVFTNVINPRAAVSRKHEFRPTYIGRGASIGANATILCGVKIGAYAMIGAGTVVIRDVVPYALVVGNPARQIGWVSQEGHKLDFSEGSSCYIAEEQRTYHLSHDGNTITYDNQ